MKVPWKERKVEEIRAEFIKRLQAKEASKSALCREYGISRVTGDKWLARWESGDSLANKGRRPFHSPNKTPAEMEQRIVELRKQYPAIGAVKLCRMLLDRGHRDVPGKSTVNEILHRNGLITPQASAAHKPMTRFERESPNMLWQADFKGHYAMQDGNRCHPLSIIDDCSRFCLSADAKLEERLNSTKESFIKAFRNYGLPLQLLCDNGNPWGASQSAGITQFDVWMMDLGILPSHIRPKHPQTQGKVERFNGSFKQESLAFYTPDNLLDADRQRQEYRDFYNHKRPHHALGLDVPASRYTASLRAYPEQIRSWEYGEEYHVCKIKGSGYITIAGQGYFLSEGLRGCTVGYLPAQDEDGVVEIHYRNFRVAKINLRESAVFSRKIYRLEP